MFLLPKRLREFFQKKKRGKKHVYSLDEDAAVALLEDARSQGRSEEEILGDFTRKGHDQLIRERELESLWDTLTRREQEVLALACMGQSASEIGGTLYIALSTVRTHFKNIFYKFKVHSRQELCLAMKDWRFEEWWQSTHN